MGLERFMARLLRNPLYAGFITCGAERVPGEHEALIDYDTWDVVQRILDRNRAACLANRGVNPDYVLCCLLRCGHCGEAMCPGSTRRGKIVHRYYRCSTRDKHGTAACPASPLPAAAIETYVAARVAEFAEEENFTRGAHASLQKLCSKQKDLVEKKQRHLTERVREATARAGKLADAWMDAAGPLKDTLAAHLSAAQKELAH